MKVKIQSRQKVIDDNVFVPSKTKLDYEGFTVTGNFYCSDLKIRSLKGSPKHVGGTFNCTQSTIISIRGAPSYIGGDFICSYAHITSLHNVHKQIKYIGSKLILSKTVKANLIGIMLIRGLKELRFGDMPNDEQLQLENIFNKHLWFDRNVHDCQEELFEAGLGEYARL